MTKTTSTITVAQTGAVQSVTFKRGMTVAAALAAASITVGRGREIRVNGAAANADLVLKANDTVLIVGAIRGAASTVTVAQTGAVQSVSFKRGMTVDQALKSASVTVGRGREIRVNGAAASGDLVLKANDTILIVGAIRGAASTVTVAQTGAVQSVNFKRGMTVDQALKSASVTVGRGREILEGRPI